MIDIPAISSGLALGNDGIWYAGDEQAISYPTDGNRQVFEVENHSFWFRHRNQCIVAVAREFPPPANTAIFDIGGGNGFVSMGLKNAGFEVVLIEPGPQGALNAKHRGLSHVICGTTTSANIQAGSLGAVGLFDVIEHLEDDSEFLHSIRKLLQTGGRLYATVPAYSWLWSSEDQAAGHFKRYQLKTLCKLLNSTGFEVNFSTYFFMFLPLPIFVLRALPYRMGLAKAENTRKNVARDHGVDDSQLNRLMTSIHQHEVKQIAKGKQIPFGGSCLVVATAI